MWIFKKKINQRRLEVRRSAPAVPPWYSRWFEKPGSVTALSFAAAFLIIACMLNILPIDQFHYRRGQYIPHDINSRVTFRVLKKNLNVAIKEAQNKEPYVFEKNTPHLNSIISWIKQFPARLTQAKSVEQADPKLLAEIGITLPDDKLKAENPKLAESQLENARKVFAAWKKMAPASYANSLKTKLTYLKNNLVRAPFIVAGKEENNLRPSPSHPIHIKLIGEHEPITLKDQSLVANDSPNIDTRLADALTGFSDILQPGIITYLRNQIKRQPIYLYNSIETQKLRTSLAKRYRKNPPPELFKEYKKNDNLVKKSTAKSLYGEPLGLSDAGYNRLKQEHEHYIRHLNSPESYSEAELAELDYPKLGYFWRHMIELTSRAFVLGLIVALMCIYVVRYQPRLIGDTRKIFALFLLLTLTLTMVKITNYTLKLNPYIAIFPIAIACIILTITYDQRFSLAFSTMLAFMVSLQSQSDTMLLIALLTSVVTNSLQIREIRTRSRLVMISLLSAGAVFVMIWLLGVTNEIPWRFTVRNALWGAGATLLAGLVVQSLLPAIEILFGIATGSTLLEWCDASKPLLRRLAMESPGTYNHSLQLGTMCEAAAEAIGARGLLARVGAYYHDIGKINKPHYFTENQTGKNKHEKLSPAMSLLIILNHVKDGLEMANQYNLPDQLREFIVSHHGTTLVKYFYHTAKEQALAEGQEPPDELQFRYPGPKPHSKEAAILMLADAAESSVRSMTEPTPTRIRTQVHEVVTARLEDGQLDNCEMTLQDVHTVEESLIKSLCGMYHGRIAYPKDTKDSAPEKKSSNPADTNKQSAGNEKSDEKSSENAADKTDTKSDDDKNLDVEETNQID